MNSDRRVVITGMGIISPLGNTVDKNWQALCQGKSGIGLITKFDTTDYLCKIAGEIKSFSYKGLIENKEARKMDIFIQYALVAGKQALVDAKLEITDSNAERIGVYVGAGIGGITSFEKWHKILLEKGPSKITPFFIPMMIVNLAPGQISIYFGTKGPNTSIVSACATGNHSIGEAYKTIQRNDADVMIAGGTESAITPLSVAGFTSMNALSTRNDAPQRASRPFDKERDGFVISEGAGVLILEELQHARKRDVNIYAEIIGYASTSDAFHIAAPNPQGAIRCMRLALAQAKLDKSQIDYINAHGTSTLDGDISETKAIKEVFADNAFKIPISSTKSMTGHLLGAAGGVESIYTILTINNGLIPPTINYENSDPECDLDYVPNYAKEKKVNIAMTNSFGFGGTNATLIFKEFKN